MNFPIGTRPRPRPPRSPPPRWAEARRKLDGAVASAQSSVEKAEHAIECAKQWQDKESLEVAHLEVNIATTRAKIAEELAKDTQPPRSKRARHEE